MRCCCFHMARERKLVLVFALHVPLLGRDLHALAHRESGTGLGDARKRRFEMRGPQPEPGVDALHRRARGVYVEQDAAEFVAVHDGSITDRVGTPGDAALDLSECDFVRDHDCRFDAGTTGSLQIDAGRTQRQPGVDNAFAREVPVAGVLDNGTESDIAHRLAAEIVLVDQPAEGRRHQFLVRTVPVNRVRSTKGDSRAADHGDAYGTTIVQHDASEQYDSHERAATLHY